MTPEREAILRKLANDHEWGCNTFVADLLAALDAARAERDELRGKVEAFRVRLFEEYQRRQIIANVAHSEVAKAEAAVLLAVFDDGLRSRLFPMDEDRWQAQFGDGAIDNGCRCPAPGHTRSDCPAHGDLQVTMDDPAASEGE